jgi:hypothetical protein
MCHKCDDGLWAKDLSQCVLRPSDPVPLVNPEVFKGCKADSRIDESNNYVLCPIRKKVLALAKKVVDKSK